MSVVIVGGGVMGAATACFLARDHGAGVVVVERDPTFNHASSALSASSIRQQFSTPVNIALSQWSIAFLRRLGDELAVDGDVPTIGLVEAGYLYLATPAGAELLQANHDVQRAAGAEVVLLSAAELRRRFPWLATDDVALGSLGLRGEGWFDGPALWQAFRRKAAACGVRFISGDVDGFACRGDRIEAALTATGQRVEGDAFVLACGAWTAHLAARLGVALPVAAKKRDVFVLSSPASLPQCPLVIDPGGAWFRPEGEGFIAGCPPRGDDPDNAALDVDLDLFDDCLWPMLAARVPAFEALRLRSAWAGYYEMNTFDHNGLVGPLPGWHNAFTACGFSGHGMQQAPAVGSALAARIAKGSSSAPAIDALSPQRLLDKRPLVERNVI